MSSASRIFSIVLILFWGEVFYVFAEDPSPPGNGTGRLTLALRDRVEVGADTLALRDLADFGIESRLADTLAGAAPALGKSITIRREDLDQLLRRANPAVAWDWQGARECVVSRPAVEVAEKEIIPLIDRALKTFSKGEGDARVFKLVNYSALLVPKKNAVTAVELVSPNTGSRFGTASIHVEYRDQTFLRRNVRFEWEWKRPVWVAQRALPGGRIPSDGFSLETRDVLNLSGEAFPPDSPLTNLALLRSVTKGDALLFSNVRAPIAVTSGSAVTASIHSGSLLVSVRGIALESGSLGQTIRVQNPDSRKELFGRITGENMVEVMP